MNSVTSLSNALALLTALTQSSRTTEPSSATQDSKTPAPSNLPPNSGNSLLFGQVSTGPAAAALVNMALGLTADQFVAPDALFVAQVSHNSTATLVEANGLNRSDSYGTAVTPFFEQQAQLFMQENSMTSQQISDALYSGKGLQNAGGVASSTFDSMIASMESCANINAAEAQWLSQGMPADNNPHGFLKSAFANFTPDQLTARIAEGEQVAASETKAVASLLTAFNDHTITFQKATDVQGLDFTQTYWTEQIGPTQTGSGSDSYNHDFLNHSNDGKQHGLAQFGSVMVYMSW